VLALAGVVVHAAVLAVINARRPAEPSGWHRHRGRFRRPGGTVDGWPRLYALSRSPRRSWMGEIPQLRTGPDIDRGQYPQPGNH
jgi:hypothetical protein